MAANDPITGKITFWAGKTFGTARKFMPEYDTALLDNAVGSKAVSLAPDGKVFEQIPLDSIIVALPKGPHVLDGENLYVAVDPDTNAKAFDSTGSAGGVVKIKYLFVDRSTGLKEIRSITSDAPRNTTILQGGLTDDMTVYNGRPNAVYAFQLVPAGCDATILGHVQIDLRTTA